MNEDAKDPDRNSLKPRKAYWSGDPEQTLTEPELVHVLEYFGASKTAKDPKLRFWIKVDFQEFMRNGIDELCRSRPRTGRWTRAQEHAHL
jgi:hypothetical protein